MSYPTAAGYPTFESAGVYPTVWARQMNLRNYKEGLLPRITTSKYLVALKDQGEKVVVRRPGTINFGEYKAGQDIDLQVPEPTAVELTMKKTKYMNIGVDDTTLAQTDIKTWMKEHEDEAMRTFDEEINEEFFASIITGAHADNAGATAGKESHNLNLGTAAAPLVIGFGTGEIRPENFLLVCRLVLKEQSAFIPGKTHVVVPEWFELLAMQSDLKKANEMGDDKSIVRSGYLGEIARMNVWPTLHLSKIAGVGGTAIVPFMNMEAIAYLQQLKKIEAYRPEKRFMNALKGLWGYDWGVYKPENLGVAYVQMGTMRTT
jgi:hypothetical protein